MRISDWSSDVCSSDLRFQAGCALEGQRLPWPLMPKLGGCAALPGLRHAMWPLRPSLRPWPCPSRSSARTDSEHQSDRHSRTRSEEHTSELQSLMRISYAVFCLKTKIRQSPSISH